MNAARFAAIAPALATLGEASRLDPPRWVGEGALWAEASPAPLRSFDGIGPQFHTPADTPAATTSAELLGAACDGVPLRWTPGSTRVS